ncbi:MAG: precorrin-8X methylmutase [Coriobacteriia bacterium]|nr:precorrin-8X methylmutase [Coriobacteriia bacterium]
MAKVELLNPVEIENESMRMISLELGDAAIDVENESIVKRVIHTTADFDYAKNLVFSPGVVKTAVHVLESGARIVTDTKMGMAGISKPALEKTGSTVHCFIDDPDVLSAAQAAGSTRALAAIDHAVANLEAPLVFVVGNAPTALIRLYELVTDQGLLPSLIIAVPVGFVNVVESKELVLSLDVPYIVARGRKGGSNVAAAIVNALLYQATGRVI